MASVADDFRSLADSIRAIPAEFGLREYTVALVRKTWTEDQPGDGDQIETLIPLTVAGGRPPKVKFPSQRDVALGAMSLGEILVGPLTPRYVTNGAGGVDRKLFDGDDIDVGVGQVIRVTSPNSTDSSDYMVNYSVTDRAFQVVLKCTNVMASGG